MKTVSPDSFNPSMGINGEQHFQLSDHSKRSITNKHYSLIYNKNEIH
ncbi:hypothetical protein MGO_05294 [Candida albicans P76055]|nr:hypothetical protein MGO_05294 [Candida albicans P76055]